MIKKKNYSSPKIFRINLFFEDCLASGSAELKPGFVVDQDTPMLEEWESGVTFDKEFGL